MIIPKTALVALAAPLFLALILSAQIAVSQEDATAAELIKGDWKCVKVNEEGARVAKVGLIFRFQEKASIHDGDKCIAQPENYSVDSTKDPKTLDIVSEDGGQSLQAIFELSGDKMKFCFGSPRTGRPKSFDGPGYLSVELERVR